MRERGLLTLSLEVGQVQRNWPKQGAQSGDPPPEVGRGQWPKQGEWGGRPLLGGRPKGKGSG